MPHEVLLSSHLFEALIDDNKVSCSEVRDFSEVYVFDTNMLNTLNVFVNHLQKLVK